MTRREFREQHIPMLRAECQRQALWLAWGNRGFGECLDAVLSLALRCGASRMNNRDMEDLERWAGQTITAAAAKHAPAAQAHQAAVDRTWQGIRAWAAECNAIRTSHARRAA